MFWQYSCNWNAGLLTPTTNTVSPYIPHQTMSAMPAHPAGDPSVPQTTPQPIILTDEATTTLRELISKPPTAPSEEYIIVNGVKYIREGTNPANAPSHQNDQVAPVFRNQANEALDVSHIEPAGLNQQVTTSTGDSGEDALSSEPIKVVFNDSPTVFYVQEEILLRFLSPEADFTVRGQLTGGRIVLEDTSPSSVSTLIRAFYSSSPDPADLHLQDKTLAQLLDLYATATRIGNHDWIRKSCLGEAADRESSAAEVLAAFEKLYVQGKADNAARECFKNQLWFAKRPSRERCGQASSTDEELIRASRAGCDLAEDIAKLLLKYQVSNRTGDGQDAVGHPGPAIDDTQCVLHQGAIQLPIRQPRMPNAGHNWSATSVWGIRQQVLDPADDLTPRPRSGWVETAPPSEVGDIFDNNQVNTLHWGNDIRGNAWNVADGNEDNASDGGARLGPTTKWLRPDEWEHTGPSAAGIERARSASEVANDGWSVNMHERDDSWDVPANGWDASVNSSNWQAVHIPKVNIDPARTQAGASHAHQPSAWPRLPAASSTPLPSYVSLPPVGRPPSPPTRINPQCPPSPEHPCRPHSRLSRPTRTQPPTLPYAPHHCLPTPRRRPHRYAQLQPLSRLQPFRLRRQRHDLPNLSRHLRSRWSHYGRST